VLVQNKSNGGRALADDVIAAYQTTDLSNLITLMHMTGRILLRPLYFIGHVE